MYMNINVHTYTYIYIYKCVCTRMQKGDVRVCVCWLVADIYS